MWDVYVILSFLDEKNTGKQDKINKTKLSHIVEQNHLTMDMYVFIIFNYEALSFNISEVKHTLLHQEA